MPKAQKANADVNNAASSQLVGEQIRDLRKIRTLTLQGLADKIGRSVWLCVADRAKYFRCLDPRFKRNR